MIATGSHSVVKMKQIIARENHLFVEFSEPYELQTCIDLMQEISEICRRDNITKVLGDIRNMPGRISAIDRFKLGIAGADIIRRARVAIVYRKEDLNWFFETVIVNRGANVRVFDNTEEASKWLGIDSPDRT